MAKNTGQVKMSGKLGNLVFYDSPYGPLVRGKGNLDKKRVKKDPAFARSRNASTEFSRASAGGKLLRGEVARSFKNVVEYSTNYRLNKVLMAAIQAEKVHGPGLRVLAAADVGNLKGFEWNMKRVFSTVYKSSMEMEIDRETGVMRVTLPALNFKRQLDAPEGATHVQMAVVGMAPDFDKEKCETVVAQGALWKLADGKAGAQVLECELKPKMKGHLILGVGIQAYQEVSGTMNGLRHGDAFVIGMVDSGVQE